MEFLRVEGITKRSKHSIALHPTNFTVSQHQKLAICGESGSGKSTLLKILSGYLQSSEGKAWFNGIPIKGPEEQLLPGHSKIAYLSQHYELRNHYRVAELLDMASVMTHEEVNAICSICNINHLVYRKTSELSGGEKQRIALALLLLGKPTLLLLDEPFSSLDLTHKSILKKVLTRLSDELDITFILASHEPSDVLSWADHLIILRDGEIVQQASPEVVYRQPVNKYVAGLLGRYILLSPSLAASFGLPFHHRNECLNIKRPENFYLLPTTACEGVTGMITTSRFLGAFYEIDVLVGDETIPLFSAYNNLEPGKRIRVMYRESAIPWPV